MFCLLFVAMLAACGGGHGSEPTDEQLCKKMSTLCESVEHLDCFTAKDWAEMQHDIGKDKTTKFRRCVAKANDCGGLTGCAVELGLSLRGLGGKQPHEHHDDDRDDDVTHHDDGDHGNGDHDDHSAPSAGSQSLLHYDSVTVRAVKDSFGYHIAVSIELTVDGDMPHIGGEPTVEAFCDAKTDKGEAFRMKLTDAQKGDRRSDTIELFNGQDFDAAPARCDLILSVSKGSTPIQKYCYENGKTSPGACK